MFAPQCVNVSVNVFLALGHCLLQVLLAFLKASNFFATSWLQCGSKSSNFSLLPLASPLKS